MIFNIVLILSLYFPAGDKLGNFTEAFTGTASYTSQQQELRTSGGYKAGNWNYFHETMPLALMDEAVVYSDMKLFVIGGYRADSSTSVPYVHIFDFTTEIWDTGASMPIDLCMYDAAIIGDTIYIPGGYSYSTATTIDSFFKYSISSNSWSTEPGIEDSLWFYSTLTVNGKLYRIGGHNNVTGITSKSTWEYDPSTGIWSKKADIPYPIELMARWVRNDTIFIAGGVDAGTSEIKKASAFYIPVADTWIIDTTVFPELPEPIWGMSFAIFHDTLFLYGGVDTTWALTPKTYYLAPSSNEWIQGDSLPLPTYRADGLAITGLGDYDGVYNIGGSISGFTPTDTIQTTAPGYSDVTEYRKNHTSQFHFMGRTVYIPVKETGTLLSVFDVTGKIIKNTQINSSGKYRISGLEPGVYFIQLKSHTEKITGTIIITE